MSMATNGITCGICHKEGATAPWASDVSKFAHSSCFKKIKELETGLHQEIKTQFSTSFNQEAAHVVAIRAVKEALNGKFGEVVSSLSEEQKEMLRDLFNSIGIQAVHQYAHEMKTLYTFDFGPL